MNAIAPAALPRRSAIGKYARRELRKAARMIGLTLVQATPWVWSELADLLALQLSLDERSSLAFTALRSLPDDDVRQMVAGAATAPNRVGAPELGLGDLAAEAEGWARLASRDELKIYAAAIWLEMRLSDQAAFRRFIDGGARGA